MTKYPAEYYDNKVVNFLVDHKTDFEKILSQFNAKRTFKSTVEYNVKGEGKLVKFRETVHLGLSGLNLEHIADILDIP